jgi:AraC-like DNA-binding protein
MPLVNVDRSRAPAFGLSERFTRADSGWHEHRKHQLLHATRGSMRLWVERDTWLLPQGRTAWIPARVRHRVVCSRLWLQTVYLPPRIVAPAPTETVVFDAPPLAREMLAYAMRLGPDHRPTPRSRSFFQTLALLSLEWIETPLPLRLPRAKTAGLQRAMDWTVDNLDAKPTAAQAARAAGMSTRTMARRFAHETDTTWRRFAHDARIIEATHRLSQPDAQVGEVASSLGFDSLSAFSRAFKSALGHPPSSMLRGARS